ncbi:MAG: L-2-hydroxyglutarate oxidase LhgO [Granulosicoccus sp.]|jgi:L-2-hydroxyglutarate oxidase LhgO
MEYFDHCIIGAGVVGLAIAFKLSKRCPYEKILLIESHQQFGSETSSRNSEVIHAGIYYPEKSLKAELCIKGSEQLYQFCQQHSVPYKRIGKLIIASDERDIKQLEEIRKNAQKSNVELTLIDQKDCLKLEPNVQAKAALLSPNTGIVDSHQYMQTLLNLAEQQGILYSPNTQFLSAEQTSRGFHVRVNTIDGPFEFDCQQIINSAGLHATKVARSIVARNASAMTKGSNSHSLIPQYHYCRGQYFSYQTKSPFSHLIYPVPNKNTTGLGIHATLDLSGQVRFGPDVEFIETLNYSCNKNRKIDFIHAIQQYFRSIDASKLVPSYCGIRPKLTGPDESTADFMIHSEEQHSITGLINLFGIESPGLTASLAIADRVTDMCLRV